MQALKYAVRLSRPENTPKLQGMYIFGPRDVSICTPLTKNLCRSLPVDESKHWQSDRWFEKDGRIFPKVPDMEWSDTIQACQGIISFDLPLCNGPYHSHSAANTSQYSTLKDFYRPPSIASHALGPCSGCSKAPEGFLTLKNAAFDCLPLVAPPPSHSSSIKSAKTPDHSSHGPEKKLLMRCAPCLRNRYCESCYQWWCEDCFDPPTQVVAWRSVDQSIEQDSRSATPDRKRAKVLMGLCIQSCLLLDKC